eukprot:scaffold58602_cov62-Phaeocystis_antarctica.AAC.6
MAASASHRRATRSTSSAAFAASVSARPRLPHTGPPHGTACAATAMCCAARLIRPASKCAAPRCNQGVTRSESPKRSATGMSGSRNSEGTPPSAAEASHDAVGAGMMFAFALSWRGLGARRAGVPFPEGEIWWDVNVLIKSYCYVEEGKFWCNRAPGGCLQSGGEGRGGEGGRDSGASAAGAGAAGGGRDCCGALAAGACGLLAGGPAGRGADGRGLEQVRSGTGPEQAAAEHRPPPPWSAARVCARPRGGWRGRAVAAGAPRRRTRGARGGGPVSGARRPRAGRYRLSRPYPG